VRETSTRPWMRKIMRMIRAGFDIIIPPRCMGCNRMGATWCEVCQKALLAPAGSSCPSCGLPRIHHTCPACRSSLKSLRVRAIASYKPPLSDALVSFKYRPDMAFADILAYWLQQKLDELDWKPDVLIPVPLNKVRLQQRGYNQVELITSALARSTNIPHNCSSLFRVRDTRSQVGLDPAARFANLDQAFMAEPGALRDQKVLLVDDLLTTGATILSCTDALIDAGASWVFAIAIARA